MNNFVEEGDTGYLSTVFQTGNIKVSEHIGYAAEMREVSHNESGRLPLYSFKLINVSSDVRGQDRVGVF